MSPSHRISTEIRTRVLTSSGQSLQSDTESTSGGLSGALYRVCILFCVNANARAAGIRFFDKGSCRLLVIASRRSIHSQCVYCVHIELFRSTDCHATITRKLIQQRRFPPKDVAFYPFYRVGDVASTRLLPAAPIVARHYVLNIAHRDPRVSSSSKRVGEIRKQ